MTVDKSIIEEHRIVYGDYAGGQEFGQKTLLNPCMEEAGVVIGYEQARGQERSFD